MTSYDAAYIALAEALGVPLHTCDAKLDRAGMTLWSTCMDGRADTAELRPAIRSAGDLVQDQSWCRRSLRQLATVNRCRRCDGVSSSSTRAAAKSSALTKSPAGLSRPTR